MKIGKGIEQIRVDFQVTESVRRYVFVYLLVGKGCYLVDAGVAGCETQIARCMENMGRKLEEIRGIFLTHAHPDHIGGAAAIKRLTGCKIYAPYREKEWIENVEKQYQDRPIPNFYRLVPEAVKVDEAVTEGKGVRLEDGIHMRVLETPGHSHGSVTYVWEEEGTAFTGDAIPDPSELPILTDWRQSRASVEKLLQLGGIRHGCPAWDRVYEAEEWVGCLKERLSVLDHLKECVEEAEETCQGSLEEKLAFTAERMGWRGMVSNPLFCSTYLACREKDREWRQKPSLL
ncbi:MAG: MBL fold metallo-hydrolase [Blautia sp.]|jgi:hydroxyacylglutathione hydrolase